MRYSLVRGGKSYRGDKIGAKIKWRQTSIAVRLRDIPLIQERGVRHIEDIVAARGGDRVAIKSLKKLAKENCRELEVDIDHRDEVNFFLVPPIELGYKIKLIIDGEEHDLHSSNYSGADEIKVVCDFPVKKRQPASRSEVREAPMPKPAAAADDYDLSFGVPRSFKDSLGSLVYVNYIAIAWQLFNHLKASYKEGGPIPSNYKDAFTFLLRYHNIKSILDIGCGDVPYFLHQLLPFSRENGIKLYGIDLNISQRNDLPKELSLASADAAFLGKHFGDENFDVIVSSGVVGQVQFMRELSTFGRHTRLSLYEAEQRSLAIILGGISRLSENPMAAMYLQSFSSFFLLDQEKLKVNGVKILYWNNAEMKIRKETGPANLNTKIERLIRAVGKRDSSASTYKEELRLRNLWKQGANIAVLAGSR